MTGQHADVISGAVFGILERKGFVVLTGEAGLGKTTAIRTVMRLLADSNAESSLISHPTLNAEDFLELAMLNFGMPPVATSKAQRLKVLESFLTLADSEGKVCVLIVDEAHKLPPEALEEIRLLGNIQTDEHKLLQILLVGQNELNARLNLPELWQLKQRVAFRLSLNRLDREGVVEYIRFRWAKAGGGETLPFDESALDAIAKWSSGIPRVINAICDNALMLALSESTRTVQLEHIQLVCQDLHLATPAIAQRTEVLDKPVRTEVPTLVRRAAVGGSTLDAPLLQRPPLTTAAEGESWSTARPSLLQKWRGFIETQKSSLSNDAHKPGNRKDSGSLSLKKHL
ncbi:MAG: AAA family ATPase [Bryobacteraceae bacterium]